jgi:radical SAM protein with 4Fe4S-binding SPASM domain
MAFYSMWRLLRNARDTCGIFGILGILPAGQLAMCGIGMQNSDLVYGQIGATPIVDVWTSHHTLIDLRKSIPAQLEGVCSDCLFRNRCLGNCIAENYETGKSVKASHWFCQMAKDNDLFPVSRMHIKENAI